MKQMLNSCGIPGQNLQASAQIFLPEFLANFWDHLRHETGVMFGGKGGRGWFYPSVLTPIKGTGGGGGKGRVKQEIIIQCQKRGYARFPRFLTLFSLPPRQVHKVVNFVCLPSRILIKASSDKHSWIRIYFTVV